jgi:hypothetical protein
MYNPDKQRTSQIENQTSVHPCGLFCISGTWREKYVYKRILNKYSKRKRGAFLGGIMDIYWYCHIQRVVKGRSRIMVTKVTREISLTFL